MFNVIHKFTKEKRSKKENPHYNYPFGINEFLNLKDRLMPCSGILVTESISRLRDNFISKKCKKNRCVSDMTIDFEDHADKLPIETG